MAFTRFPDLPPELRGQIWEEHCPQLAREPLWLQVIFDPEGDEVTPTFRLHRQTAATRTVLRLSRDSRAHALQRLPDAIALRKGRGIIRFSAQRDMVFLSPDLLTTAHYSKLGRGITGFSGSVVNVALDIDRSPWCHMASENLSALFLSFPRLRHVFVSEWGLLWSRGSIAWCASPRAHRVSPLPAGYEEPDERGMVYCWPDLVRNGEWAETAVSGTRTRGRDSVLERLSSRVRLADEEVRRLGEVRVWPVIEMPPAEMDSLEEEVRFRGVGALDTMPWEREWRWGGPFGCLGHVEED